MIHDDTRYTSLDGIILDTKAVRRRAWKLLAKGEDAEARELQTRLGRMDSTTPKQWHQFVRACALDDEEGRYSQFHPELFASVAEARDETNHFARLASLLADVLGQIGPFYFHCGGAGDALLLLASFYDQHPDAVIVSLPNSVAAMKSFFDAFPRLKRVYLLPERPDANHHLLVRMLMKLVK